MVDEHLAESHFGAPLGEPEARVLEVEQTLAEGLALAHVGQGVLQGRLGGSDGADADDQALAWQLVHKLVEALALFAAE